MSIASEISRMQLIASGALDEWSLGFNFGFGGHSQTLYFDASETQQFYLHDVTTSSLLKFTSQQAKAFVETGTAAFVLPGLTAWNLTLTPTNIMGQSNSSNRDILNNTTTTGGLRSLD